MKVIILIISSTNSPYDKLEKSIRSTWGNIQDDNIKIFYNYGNGSRPTFISGDKIICDCEETIENIGLKTIKSLRKIYENYTFDYIYRTNLSSFIDINKMFLHLKNSPRENFYSGRCGLTFAGEHLLKFGQGTFASGSGYFLSKDLVKLILDNESNWDHSVIDDVAIAGLLKNLNVLPVDCSRIDITRVNNGIFFNNNIPIDSNIINKNFHFRCKTFGDRSGDIEIFESLNKIINQ